MVLKALNSVNTLTSNISTHLEIIKIETSKSIYDINITPQKLQELIISRTNFVYWILGGIKKQRLSTLGDVHTFHSIN